jgi:hypothetical protein
MLHFEQCDSLYDMYMNTWAIVGPTNLWLIPCVIIMARHVTIVQQFIF